MIWSGRDSFERNEFLQGFDKLVLMHFLLAIRSWVTASNIPDRDRVVIASCDVQLLIVVCGDRRCQDAAFVGLPSIDAVVFLAKVSRGAFVLTILYCAIFLRSVSIITWKVYRPRNLLSQTQWPHHSKGIPSPSVTS